MNIHFLICFITDLHKKVHFKISYQWSGSVFSFQDYIIKGPEHWGSTCVLQLFFPPLFRDVDYTPAEPAVSQTHVYSFLCAVEGGIQSAFQNRLVALFCLTVLSSCHTWKWNQRRRSLQSSKEPIHLHIPIRASLAQGLSHCWTSNVILTSAFKGKLLLFTVADSSF